MRKLPGSFTEREARAFVTAFDAIEELPTQGGEMKRTLLVLAALLIAPVTAQAGEPDYVSFGDRVGMSQRIVEQSGIDTERARIVTKMDREMAQAMCYRFEDQPDSPEMKACIDDMVANPFSGRPIPAKNILTANCKTRTISAWGVKGIQVVQDAKGLVLFRIGKREVIPWYNKGYAFAWKALCPSSFDPSTIDPDTR